MKNAKKIFALFFSMLFIFFTLAPVAYASDTELITLTSWGRTETLNFQLTNMVPGDSETKEYAIKVTDKRATSLCFTIIPDDPASELLNVLIITVEQDNNILYHGPIGQITEQKYTITGDMPQTIPYKITVALDTSVGNEYMGQSTTLDFHWAINRKTEPTPPPTSISTTPTTTSTTSSTTTSTTTSTTVTSNTTPIAEPTTEMTTMETTTVETTTETITEETSTEITSSSPTPTETTTETSVSEITTAINPQETTSAPIGPGPVAGVPCCDCCVGYTFPHSCNFGNFGENDIGCDLPWCCAGNNECWCPWCWIIPLIILIVLIIIVIIIIRKLTKKDKEDEEEEEENADEQTTEETN